MASDPRPYAPAKAIRGTGLLLQALVFPYSASAAGDFMSTADHATRVRVEAPPAAGARYTATAQALHWITALLMFAVLPLAWVMLNMPKEAESRGLLFTLHKSIGLTIFALVAFRLLWRARHPAPPLAEGLPPWIARSAVTSHWLLYLILVGMPISGYLLTAAGGYPISFFGLFNVPGLPKNEALDRAATWAHVAVGQWAVYALILLHVGATAWHAAVRRDGVLNRMLPPQAER
jgi:cytochrome b561